MSKLSKILAAVFVLVVVLVVVFFVIPPPPVPPPPLPVPNGYTNLVQAGLGLKGEAPPMTETNPVIYFDFLMTSQPSLVLARLGLSQSCQVPLEYSEEYLTYHMTELSLLKRLAQTFAAEGRWAEIDGRPGDALNSYLNVVRLGYCTAQGGVVIDKMVALAIEAIGLDRLDKLAKKLEAQQCRAVLHVLENMEAEGDTLDDVLAQERVFGRQAFGWRGRLAALVNRRGMQQMYDTVIQKMRGREAQRRQVRVNLAARAYELETGAPPKNTAALVPTYLKAIPTNAATSKPIRLE